MLVASCQTISMMRSIYACPHHIWHESQAHQGWWQHILVFHAGEISLCQCQTWPFNPVVWSCPAQAAGHIQAAPYLQPEFVQRQDPLSIPIRTTLSPQHINKLLLTVYTWTSLLSHVWQHDLCTRVWVQPVSTSAVHFFPLICTFTMGSALSTGDLGEKTGAEVFSLYLFPRHSWAVSSFFCIYSTGLAF